MSPKFMPGKADEPLLSFSIESDNSIIQIGYSFDYDVCNADILLNLMEVKDGRITTPSGMSYRVLVLPPGDRMTLPVLQKIAKLVRDGAVVY